MKNLAIGILIVIALSILVQPLIEMANIFKEKILLSSALNNASRVAKDHSFEYESRRELDAVLHEEKFRAHFADAFAKTLNLTRSATSGNTMTFISNDGRYHPFSVTLTISSRTDDITEQLITEVEVTAETKYKFEMKYLQLAEAAGMNVDYHLRENRRLILSIKN